MTRWFAVPATGGTVVGDGRGTTFPLAAYGLTAASGDPESFLTGSGANNNTIFAVRIGIPSGTIITALWAAVRTGGSHVPSGTPNRLGLYTDEGVQIGVTADDPTLWTQAGWRGGVLPVPVAAEPTDRCVYVLTLVGGMSGLSVPYMTLADDSHAAWFCRGVDGGNRRAMYAGGTALPASFDPTAYGTATTYVPLVGTS